MNRCVNYAISINTESEKSGNSDANLVPFPMQFQFVTDRNAVGRITRHIHYRALFIGNLCDFVGEWTRSDSALYGLFGIACPLKCRGDCFSCTFAGFNRPRRDKSSHNVAGERVSVLNLAATTGPAMVEARIIPHE